MRRRPTANPAKRWLLATVWSGLVILLTSGGCMLRYYTRADLDIVVDPGQNPPGGSPVRIRRVTDRRVFALTSLHPDVPSLKDDAIGDRSVTARAIGRKSDQYGRPKGDFLLPAGRTVPVLVGEIVSSALRGTGYRIVSESDPDWSDAPALAVDIERFWSWVTYGIQDFELNFDALLCIRGDLEPFEAGRTVHGYSRRRTWNASLEAGWIRTIEDGIEELKQSIARALMAQEPDSDLPSSEYARDPSCAEN